jgi:D-arabinose 1-dehydrogenase-like Zn-dependent alcohol dehydrogenase
VTADLKPGEWLAIIGGGGGLGHIGVQFPKAYICEGPNKCFQGAE